MPLAFPSLHRLPLGKPVSLAKIDPRGTPGLEASGSKKSVNGELKQRAEAELAANVEATAHLQEMLFAENQQALLVILQGMDTSGKDGVIRHVFSGINPQGCHVTSFKKPTEPEADRDYLWRIHQAVPAKGEIGIFNRAHYEDVLIVRVHNFVPASVWKGRYAQINEFEAYLTANHVTILKFMLHISKDEQKERLQARLDDPEKRWKFNLADLAERKYWPAYQEAYEAALEKCNTEHSPWYVIPADRKWYRNWAISTIVRQTLEGIAPKPPKVSFDVKKIVIE